MRRLAFLLFPALLAASAMAQELRQNLDVPPPGSIEILSSGKLVMSSDVCTTLSGAPPVPSAEYREGIDAQGRRVAPADLPSSPPPVTVDNFPIEIRKDLAGKFNVPASGGAYGAKAILGYVTLRDNRAYFNGQPMGEDQRAALVDACGGAKP